MRCKAPGSGRSIASLEDAAEHAAPKAGHGRVAPHSSRGTKRGPWLAQRPMADASPTRGGTTKVVAKDLSRPGLEEVPGHDGVESRAPGACIPTPWTAAPRRNLFMSMVSTGPQAKKTSLDVTKCKEGPPVISPGDRAGRKLTTFCPPGARAGRTLHAAAEVNSGPTIRGCCQVLPDGSLKSGAGREFLTGPRDRRGKQARFAAGRASTATLSGRR